MLDYLIRRMLLIIPTLIGITIVTFGIMKLAPGDPASLRAGDIMDPAMSDRIQQELRERFHLDEPLPTQYFLWLSDLITGKSKSMTDDLPVLTKIKDAFWPTVKVNLTALILAFVLSFPIGIYAAAHRNGWFDRAGGVVLYVLYSIPSYVGAIVLLLYLSVRWGWLPLRGMQGDDYPLLSNWGKFLDATSHMTLYVICTTYGSLAYYSRFVRQNLLEVIRQDYIRTARAKGLPHHVVVLKHAVRNTMIPFITLAALTIPPLIGGSVILEVIFTWPGLGRLFFISVLERDYPVVMALSTATAVLVLFATLAADLLYGWVDPRVGHR
ncbi:MAG: ABC transporter permease [Planctomycetota bacterium]